VKPGALWRGARNLAKNLLYQIFSPLSIGKVNKIFFPILCILLLDKQPSWWYNKDNPRGIDDEGEGI
jgi:hypothetical protein